MGLWQVSNGTHQYPAAWTSAAGNASEAVAKYKAAGNSFAPWGTYESGAYKAYVSAGSTPDTNVPGSTTETSGNGSSTSSGSSSDCVIGFNGVLGLGKACLLDKSELRGVIGAWVMIGAGVVGLVGAVILAAAAFQKSGALQKTADAAAMVPGGGAVAEGLTVAHRRASRGGAQVASERRGARVTAQRQQARRERQAASTAAREQRQARGRHARTGPNAPARGRHAAPAPAPA